MNAKCNFKIFSVWISYLRTLNVNVSMLYFYIAFVSKELFIFFTRSCPNEWEVNFIFCRSIHVTANLHNFAHTKKIELIIEVMQENRLKKLAIQLNFDSEIVYIFNKSDLRNWIKPNQLTNKNKQRPKRWIYLKANIFIWEFILYERNFVWVRCQHVNVYVYCVD